MNRKTIYLAGGCFWGTQHFFQQLGGILESETGFANGNTENPTYKEVYTDTTGYAETVRLVYDTDRLGLERLLNLYFLIIDPTSINCQGEDHGTRYRTGIYYSEPEDLPTIQKVYGEQERKAGAKLAVEVEPLRNFTAADEYHQFYLDKNPQGYCHLPLKVFAYAKLLSEAELFLGDEPDTVARMANVAAMIQEKMGFFWTGFYIVKPNLQGDGEELVLGPFQGPAACVRIRKGRGVCGTAWERNETIIVPDVEKFPGHIACSSLSRSEIVVPVYGKDGRFMAELDIDSKELGTFDKTDGVWLKLITKLIYR